MKFAAQAGACILSSIAAALLCAQPGAVLEWNTPVTEKITGGQSRSYQIDVQAGEYIEVEIVEQGIGISCTLSGPDGKELLQSQTPNPASGSLFVFHIAAAAGVYRLDAAAYDPAAPAGAYQVRWLRRGAPSAEDRTRVEAGRLYSDGGTLIQKSDADSQRAARDDYAKAARLFHGTGPVLSEIYSLDLAAALSQRLRDLPAAAGAWETLVDLDRRVKDRGGEAIAVRALAWIYDDLGDSQKAIAYYEQALPIERELKDRRGEGATLANLGLAYDNLGQSARAIEFSQQALAVARETKDRESEGTVLSNLGLAYDNLSQFEKAIEYYQQALPIRKEVRDRQGEGVTLNSIGMAYAHMSQAQKALGYLEQSLAIRREVADRPGESTVLNNFGFVYESLSQEDKAIGYFEQALAIEREMRDRRSEGPTLNNLGLAYSKLSQQEKALGYYQLSLEIYRQVRDRRGEARSLVNIGQSYLELSQAGKAITYFDQGLAIARELGDRQAEAAALSNLGAANSSISRYEGALGYYRQALDLTRQIKDRLTEGKILSNMGEVYSRLSRQEQAIAFFEQALAIRREVKDREGEGVTLNNIGMAYHALSQYEKAMGYLEQALAIEQEVKHRAMEGTTLQNIGLEYQYLAQYKKAIEYFERGLAVHREVKDRRGEAQTLNNLGTAYRDLNQPAKAIGYFEQALAIEREVGDRQGEGATLSNAGAACQDMNRPEQALKYFTQALAMERQVKDRQAEGSALNNLAGAYLDLGQYPKALGDFEQALAIAREVRNRQLESKSLMNTGTTHVYMGQAEKALGYYQAALALAWEMNDRAGEAATLENLEVAWKKLDRPRIAIFYGKQSVNILQSIRTGIEGLARESQESYLKGHEAGYRYVADLLIAQGRLPEGQQVLNLLKKDEYLQFVRRDQAETSALAGRADLTAAEAEWAGKYRQISDSLTAVGAHYGELLAKKERTAAEETELDRLEKELDIGRQGFETFLGSLATSFGAKISSGSISLDKLRDTEALEAQLGRLGHGAVAIYTLAGEDTYRTILVTPKVERAYEYPIKAADLNRKIQAFREALQNPRSDPRPLAQELFHILIVPALAEDLRQAKAETLMWSLDGALRYLPVAALFDGKQYLVEQYRLAMFTPASETRFDAAPANPKRALLGLGVTRAHEDFPALPNVAHELQGIQRDTADRELLDENFTETAMKRELRRGYPLVHIATHFNFQPGNDTQSFLLLGDGSHLSLADVKNTNQLFSGVDLLTLSACNTGMGDATADGSEVEGFGVAAQRKGASAVIASLWPVADESTSLLMQEFYRLLETQPGMLKSEALREAQVALLHGSLQPQKASVEARGVAVVSHAANDVPAGFTHPYYWAPFFLMGNWQ